MLNPVFPLHPTQHPLMGA